MHKFECLTVSLICAVGLVAKSHAAAFPDYGYQPPADWTGATFSLSQAYPATEPSAGVLPWASINPKTEPEKYMKAVIDYSFDGNIEHEFVVQQNSLRRGYHAPWMHWGPGGREFVHGLTRERVSKPFELAATQTTAQRNYAVGFYNDLGGYALGQVWKDPDHPDIAAADFPEGSVSFKLLFTTTPESQAAWLAGSPSWVADIDRDATAAAVNANKVRLLQIDIAVKDKRSLKGGWIFGTFHYDSAITASSPWRKLRALSLMWGDDPKLAAEKYASGKRPKQSWINQASPIVAYRNNPPPGINAPSTLGWLGRANGPVDNPISSCLSCHGTAQMPALAKMVPPNNATPAERLNWFRNLGPDVAFSNGAQSLNYSLQLGVGIQNHAEFKTFVANQGSMEISKAKALMPKAATPEEHRFTRDPD